MNDTTTKTVASESDARTVNNPHPDPMRLGYRVLTDAEKAQMVDVKTLGANLLEKIRSIGTSRELSIAATKTEEAVMWAVKHITA